MKTFVITGVERFSSRQKGSWNEYRVQMCGEGTKVWDSFTIPTENLGDEELPAGTRFTIALEDDGRDS